MEHLCIIFFWKARPSQKHILKTIFFKAFFVVNQTNEIQFFTGKTSLAVTKFHEDERKLQVLDSPSSPLQNLISLSLAVRTGGLADRPACIRWRQNQIFSHR